MKFLYIVFIVSFIFGFATLNMHREEFLNGFDSKINSFLEIFNKKSLIDTFFCSMYSFSIPILIIFFSGFFAIGQPIAIITIIFHALGAGFSVCYMYITKSLYGLFIYIFTFGFCEIIYIIILILAAKNSIRFSNKNFKILFPEKFKQNMQGEIKTYISKFFIILILQILVSVLDLVGRYIFIKFFV